MEHDPDSLNELLDRGLKVVPVTIWGDEVVIGFNPNELSRVFGIDAPVSIVDLPVMVEKYETVLVAAGAAIDQLPKEYMDWECPERKRKLGQFTFHLFDRPDRALNSYTVGVYTSEDRGRNMADVIGDVGFKEIIVYGEDVLNRVKAALTGDDPLDLEKKLDTYMGSKTAGELMDLALGHSVHHLKQLYEYMSINGLTPANPLGDEDFAGVAVPTELF